MVACPRVEVLVVETVKGLVSMTARMDVKPHAGTPARTDAHEAVQEQVGDISTIVCCIE